MGRVTEPKQPSLIRQQDLWIISASRAAVDRAMERSHQQNPAGYHDARPALRACPFDPECPFTTSSTQ